MTDDNVTTFKRHPSFTDEQAQNWERLIVALDTEGQSEQMLRDLGWRFSMSRWCEIHTCDTVACIGGTAELLLLDTKSELGSANKLGLVREALGITHEEEDLLFYPGAADGEDEQYQYHHHLGCKNPHIAARVCEHFFATREVAWDEMHQPQEDA